MVGPLWHFDQEQKRLLARGLIEKRIPGFSIWNISQVEQGLLAGLESEEKQDIPGTAHCCCSHGHSTG